MARYFPSEGSELRGADGGRYTLGERLGRGGQGIVHATPDGRWAVKVYGRMSDVVQQRRREQLRRVHVARLDDNVFVRSTELLAAPWVGYVMPLVKGHRPIGELAVAPSAADDLLAGWHASGGLRVRLHLGRQLAAAFHHLHAGGLAYGDLSFDNVLIPNKGRPQIKLIDCDNLVPSGRGGVEILGTPWFIAPEVLRGAAAPDALSDAHSLAVLLFHLICLVHPLLGDAVREGAPEGEEEALEGRRPWIDHPTDDSNRTRFGMPRGAVLTVKLQEAFGRAFGPGLLDPTLRPGEREWLELLAVASDALTSGSCEHDFLLRKRCPFCGAAPRPASMLLFARGTDPATGAVERRPVVLSRPLGLSARHLRFGGSVLDEQLLVGVEPLSDGSARLVNRTDEELHVFAGTSDQAPRTVPPEGEGVIHRGEALRLGARGVRGSLR